MTLAAARSSSTRAAEPYDAQVDVLGMLLLWRHHDREPVEATEQVGAKPVALDHRIQSCTTPKIIACTHRLMPIAHSWEDHSMFESFELWRLQRIARRERRRLLDGPVRERMRLLALRTKSPTIGCDVVSLLASVDNSDATSLLIDIVHLADRWAVRTAAVRALAPHMSRRVEECFVNILVFNSLFQYDYSAREFRNGDAEELDEAEVLECLREAANLVAPRLDPDDRSVARLAIRLVETWRIGNLKRRREATKFANMFPTVGSSSPYSSGGSDRGMLAG